MWGFFQFRQTPEDGSATIGGVLPTAGGPRSGSHLPDALQLQEAMRGRHQPALRDQRGPADVALALDVEADLPRPFSHIRVLPTDDPRLPHVGADPAVWGWGRRRNTWLLLFPFNASPFLLWDIYDSASAPSPTAGTADAISTGAQMLNLLKYLLAKSVNVQANPYLICVSPPERHRRSANC